MGSKNKLEGKKKIKPPKYLSDRR